MAVFKKSEEQEWTRFRGALSKDREEAAEQPEAPAAAAPPTPAPPAQPVTGPSFRPSAGDVNVTVPSRSSRSGSDGEVETLIGERSTFEGTFKAEGNVRVLGSIQGEIDSKGSIYVEEKAQVNARVTATHVTVAGRVDGQIYCTGKVEIRPTGRVTGEIQAGALIVQEGAYFEGNSKMASGTSNEPAPAPAAKA